MVVSYQGHSRLGISGGQLARRGGMGERLKPAVLKALLISLLFPQAIEKTGQPRLHYALFCQGLRSNVAVVLP